MCGRYNIVTDAQALIDAFDIAINELSEPQLSTARYNIPPTSTVPIVTMRDGCRTLSGAHWGLLPHWAKDRKLAFKTFNARAETITEKASFRTSIKKSRCIVPASGWYEWRKEREHTPALLFPHRRLDPPLPVSVHGTPNLKFCRVRLLRQRLILSPAAVHHRMPVILDVERIDQWMLENSGMDSVLSQLKPYEGDDLTITRVSTRVNNTRYHGPDCIKGVLTSFFRLFSNVSTIDN